jgi:hypothetical protein
MINPWVAGDSSAPLRITVFPQASGVAIARVARINGAFHGAMPSTTPAPWRMPSARFPGTLEDHLALDLRGQRGGFTQNIGGQVDVKTGPVRGGPVSAAIAA